MDARVLSDEVGDASALKMAYAAWTKGTAALLLAIRDVARGEGVDDALLAEWRESLPELEARLEAAERSARAKGWRWVGEMEEIAATFAAAGAPRRLPPRRGRGLPGYPRATEHMFYTSRMRVEYREEPCRSALNRVKGMMFEWSLNPYMGCAHRCTFCYVRAFERRADRPSDDRYGRSIRVKINVAEVLRTRARTVDLGRRERRRRRGDRPVPAGRGPLPADPRVPRGLRRRARTRSRSSRAGR